MASRELNKKEYQNKTFFDRLNGTLCSKPISGGGSSPVKPTVTVDTTKVSKSSNTNTKRKRVTDG